MSDRLKSLTEDLKASIAAARYFRNAIMGLPEVSAALKSGRGGLPASDRDDNEQAASLELMKRLLTIDPAKLFDETGNSNIPGLAATIAANQRVRLLRRRKAGADLGDDFNMAVDGRDADEYERAEREVEVNHEKAGSAKAAAQQLPPMQRDALLMHADGVPDEEIALRHGTDTKTIRAARSRASQTLRETAQDWGVS